MTETISVPAEQLVKLAADLNGLALRLQELTHANHGVATSEPLGCPSRAGDVGSFIAALTAELATMTGYPADMLEADLDLQADLGVDSIRQFNATAAVRKRAGLAPLDPRVELRELSTIRLVAEHLAAHASESPAGE